MNENGRLFDEGADGEFQTDFLGRRAAEELAPGRRRPAPVLHVAHVPRAAQRRADRPRRPALAAHALPRAAPPQRVRERAAAQGAELRPRGPHHQAPDRGRPAPLHARRTWRRSRRTTSRSWSRCCRWTTPSAGLLDTLERHRRAGQHGDHLHLRQRLLPRRARRALREGPALRAGHPHAADHARAGRAGGQAPEPARRQRGPGADDPRHRQRHARTGGGRPLAVRPDARPHAASWAASSCSRTAAA